MPVRQNEDELLKRIANHLPLRINNAKFTDPHTKVNVLLQAHFSRTPLSGDLRDDQKTVLETAARLLQAIIDVISSNGWLNPAVAAMEMSQMVTQGLWDRDSQLLQLPHVTKKLAAVAEKQEVEGVFDLMEMEDDDRSKLLEEEGRMSSAQMSDIAKVCNAYPNIEVNYEVEDADEKISDALAVVHAKGKAGLQTKAKGKAGASAPSHSPALIAYGSDSTASLIEAPQAIRKHERQSRSCEMRYHSI